MTVSIRDMLHSYGNSIEKTWAHDRLSTIGASEVGQCLRKLWFSKHEAEPDPDYSDRYGARLRGEILEAHYWVPGLQASLPPGVELHLAGPEQTTLVDGYLSATSDGVLTGVPRDALSHLGIPDIESDHLAAECKTIDPRVDLRSEKPEHSFQTQVQMGLLQNTTNYHPVYALISYIDASFVDDIKEFAVRFDPKIYEAAKLRAREVMITENAVDMPPEGKMAGGRECRYCPWASHCADVTVAGVPPTARPLNADAVTELKSLRDLERKLSDSVDIQKAEHAKVTEAIKEFMRGNGTRAYRSEGDDWSVVWSTVKGRSNLDAKAAEAAGVDLSPYYKEGKPGDRLIVK